MTLLPRSRRLRVALALTGLVGLYALLGFFVAPRIVHSQATSFVRTHYGRELHLGKVRVQPFLLQLELGDLSLPDADGAPLIGFRRLLIDLEVSSIWHRALVFREITLEDPSVRVEVRKNGDLNLADLKLPPDPGAKDDGPPPALWIQALSVQRGTVLLRDASRSVPLERTFDDVGFSLGDFRTTPRGGDFSFRATMQDDAEFQWSGRFALAPALSSDGEFRIAGLRAKGVAEILGDRLPFALSSGTVDVTGKYHAALGTPLSLNVELPSLALKDLGIRAPGEAIDWVRVPTLVISDTSLSLEKRNLQVGAIVVERLSATVQREADGSLNLQRLAGSGGAAPAAAPEGPPFAVGVSSLDLKQLELDIDDRSVAGGARFKLAPVDAHVGGISLDLSRPLPVSLQVGLEKGWVLVSGKVTPRPLALSLDVKVTALPLQPLSPYVAAAAGININAGELGIGGKLALDPAGTPVLSFAGDVALDGFGSVDSALHENFVSLQSLQIDGIRFAQAPDSLDIDKVLLRRPVARVVISPEGVINLTAMRGSRPAPAPARTAAAPMAIHVRQVRMEAGRVAFTDHSVKPGFAATLEDLTGTASGLSTVRSSRARLDFHGRVDESPVAVKGELQPFGFERFSDVSLDLSNVEMPIFNPYSGPVAGYSIARGKLATSIHYRIEDRRLKAEHHVRIDQLEWGTATETQGGATLPVRFATSLLKDRHGVIDLELPVDGSLDDPSFNVGPIVWKVFQNLVSKAVTAPFTMLGSLVAGAEEAQYVDFVPGTSALDGTTAGRLGALSGGLKERPGLMVDVPMGVVTELDRPALVEQALENAVTAAARTGAPSSRSASLKAVLKKLTGAEATVPAALQEAAEVAYLEKAARAALVVPEADVDALAQARSVAVEHALVAGGLEAGRIFKVREGKVSANGGKVRLELELK